MVSIHDSLNEILEDLKKNAEVEASVIASNQGLIMVSDVPEYVLEMRLGAFAATIMGSAKTVMEELHRSTPNTIMIRSQDAITIFMEAGEDAILGTLFSGDQNMGLVIVEMEEACRKISEILE